MEHSRCLEHGWDGLLLAWPPWKKNFRCQGKTVHWRGKTEAMTVVISTSVSLRCSKNLQLPSWPYNCSYFTNSKVWMNTEIMTTILSKLNHQLKCNNKHILLFMHNAPCQPQTLSEQFSNITLQFLPKNTTSKSQPLDIIAHWKVFYRKRMLRLFCF